ncbi:uncharacterized protein LOC128634916 isoform X2 [Ictalurus punctatus]|uniref:Uncharacterized protein LOC128634916 isoform X2 n=1 Tax=Ictalurus punctatus TaxID=7998 RepID=A0A9F7TNE2_ICTPU|nr:uncharacterized protein LOC128634916 isoform X2 [Ictalurus punctatus]
MSAMWVLALAGLLLHSSVHTARSDISNKNGTEGSDTLLFCVNDGKVVWSKGVDGGRRDILTAERGEIIIKHSPDPDNRYAVLSDLSLHIKNLSLSDSGVYYCNAVPVVNLTVTPSQSSTGETEKGSAGKDSGTKSDDGDGDDEKDDDDDDGVKEWIVAAVVGVSCVVLLLLSIWGFFTKRKAAQQNHTVHTVHMCDSVINLPADPQPGCSVTHIYDVTNEPPEAPRCADQQRECDAVYFLAQSPASNATGDQEREGEAVYFLATHPTSNTTEGDQVGPLYTMVQKPRNNT